MKKYRNYIIAILCLVIIITSICFVPISANKLIPLVEKQTAKDFGIDAHLENLVLRLGPQLKLKTPIMHLLYSDGQKFAQLDSVKFYIPWSSVIKKDPKVISLQSKNLTVRINSDDKYLEQIIKNIEEKNFSELPNIKLKGYKISYLNKQNSDEYALTGQELNLSKLINFKNFKLSTKGYLEINSNKYINYDISLLPELKYNEHKIKGDFIDIINKIKLLDFHSDIITDLKVYKNKHNKIQASGFVNIDNVSVFDKACPKSFVYLTLLGDKASILSNIYTAQNKKVYFEGVVNNSDKPTLDLKVKTDEIELSGLFNKLKVFTELSRLKNIDSVDGILNANFNLKGDLKKIKSNGYLKVNNAYLRAGNLKIDNINSDIDFSNNKINITNTNGYINKSPIVLKGTVDNEINLELLMSKVELKKLLPEKFGIKNGIISLVSDITGTISNPQHKENLQIDNFTAEKDKNTFSISSLKIDTNKNNTAYINNISLANPNTETIKIPSMRLNIERDSINIPETNIFMPNSKLMIKGKLTNYNNKDIAFGMTADGFINSSDIKYTKLPSGKYPIKLVFTGNRPAQNLNTQILFEKTDILDEPAILNLALKSNYDKSTEKLNLKIDDLSLLGFSGKFSDDLKQNLKGSKKLTANGLIENIKAPALKNFRISVPQILNLQFFDTIAQLKGDIFLDGNYLRPDIVGQIFIQNLFNQPTQSSLSNCTIDFNKNTASINAPLVKIADSSMGVNANIYTDFSKKITVKNLNIKSKFLNTDTILMYKDMPIAKVRPIEVQDGKFYSERVQGDIYGSPIYLTAFTSDFKLNNDIISLKNISSEIFNGKLAGSITFNLKDENFDSQIMARGVSASPIFNIISARKETISGIMDFDTSLKGNIATKKSLNGNVRFIIHNGRMSTLGKLEHLLYAQNVIADNMLRTSLSVISKAIMIKDTGLFKYLRGDVVMTNGVADIKFLQSLGPLMSLYIKGQYHPDNDYANLIVLGRLSDEIISGLGVFADFSFNKLMIMLTGEENKYNILPSDIENLPQLPVKNTKEFRSVINGTIDKASSVQAFNWISYSQKSMKQKDVPNSNVKVPSFVEELPY